MWCARAVLRCRPIKCGTADPLNRAMKKWNSRRGAALAALARDIQREMARDIQREMARDIQCEMVRDIQCEMVRDIQRDME